MATAAQKLFCRLSNRTAFRFSGLHKCDTKFTKCLHISKTNGLHTAPTLYGVTKLDMPSLSPTMEQGNIIKWHKKEGDTISPGDVLCDIETDKAVISMDTEEEGILAKVIIPENTNNVKVGTLIALMVEEGDDWKNVEVPAEAAAAAAPPTPAATAASPAPTPSQPAATPAGDGHLVGPSVKKLLQEYNINLSSLSPSGPSGALLKGDVLEYISANKLDKQVQKAPSPAPPKAPTSPSPIPSPSSGSSSENYTDIPLTSMRRAIAKNLTLAKNTIPHGYTSIDCDVGSIVELRKTLQEEGIKVSVNDFVIKASSYALQRVPRVNSIWENDALKLASSVDIAVAVAIPNGLITPIVFGASYLSVDQIGNTIKELAGKAKDGKLQPHEFQGGTFTISNLGMFGISEFTAVIPSPQVAIMAVGTTRQVACLSKGSQLKMKVTLSHDTRAISEVEATRFLEEFRHVIENPKIMLSGTNLDVEAEAFVF